MATQKVKVRIEADGRQASTEIKRTQGAFSRMSSSIKTNALKIVAALAAVAGAFRLIDKTAQEMGQRGALEATLKSQGVAIDEFLGELTKLSDAQISQADLILSSNRALKLGIQAADLPGLLTTAANAAVDLGLTTSRAFEDITTGIGRASPLILDNLGIVVDATKLYAAFAAEVGVTVEELTKQQKTIALTNAVISQNSDATQKFSERQAELTRNINRGKAAFDNLTSASGQLLGGLVQMTTSGIVATTLAISLLIEGFIKLGRAMASTLSLLPVVGSGFAAIAESLRTADDSIDGFQKRAFQLSLDLAKGGATSIQFALGIGQVGDAAAAAAKKVRDAGAASLLAAGNFTTATEAAIGLGNALGEVTSIELEAEILKINEALIESKGKMDEYGDEYLRLADIAEDKIEFIRERIESLRDGHGDLTLEVDGTALSYDNLSRSLGFATRESDGLTQSLEGQTGALLRNRAASDAASARKTIAGPTTINTGINLSGGTFTTIRRVAVAKPDGGVEFA